MEKKIYGKYVVVSVVLLLVSTQSAPAELTNGDFSNDFTLNTDPTKDWFVESGIVKHWVDNMANFVEDDDKALNSTLSQIFTLDPLSLELSFDVVMPGVFGGETDKFTASLLNPTTQEALISIFGKTYFYYLDSGDVVDDTLVTVTGKKTISLDVSSWANQEVKLVFNLEHEYDDGKETNVFLDNVSVSLVPVPGAFMLGCIGIGTFSFLRRTKLIKIF